MGQRSREGFFRRLGRALSGVNAVEYGRPVPTPDLEAVPGPTPALTVDDPYGSPPRGPDADGASHEGGPRMRRSP